MTRDRPEYPIGEADKKLAKDWYTWGFQAGMDASRSVERPYCLKSPCNLIKPSWGPCEECAKIIEKGIGNQSLFEGGNNT